MKNKQENYRCVCGCKILNVCQFNDYTSPCELELSFYSLGTEDRKTSLREKLRICWKVLKTGIGWEDQIILEKEDVKKLIKFLNKTLRLNKYEE